MSRERTVRLSWLAGTTAGRHEGTVCIAPRMELMELSTHPVQLNGFTD
jgi:hypothetical protein